MRDYFFLQYHMSNRRLRELGIHPLAGYLAGAAGFVLFAAYLFYKTEFAGYLLVLAALGLLINTAEKTRTEFLTLVFGEGRSRRIRVIENAILAFPFILALLYYRAFPEALLLSISSLALAVFSFRTSMNYTLPTPFYNRPFEFTVGFRNTFYLFAAAYVLTFIALSVDNMNLGMFAMLLLFLVSITFYVKPENEYFVWSFAGSPARFLFEKVKTATRYSIGSALPIAGVLIAFYPREAGVVLLFLLAGMLFLWTVILAKYGAYPNEMNIPEGMMIAFCIYFPPVMLFLIPYFYNRAVRHINSFLG